MTFLEVLDNARPYIKENCNSCQVCNGVACKNRMPGPGAKGSGLGAIRNYNAWQHIYINMDTIYPAATPDTRCTLFGRTFRLPVFAGPVGSVNQHYGNKYDDQEYNHVLVRACAANGIAAFTGDGLNGAVMESAGQAIAAASGIGVPTIKPWSLDIIRQKLAQVAHAHPFAMAMDIDAAGLPFLKDLNPFAGSKSVEELSHIITEAQVPFIIKGIMTPAAALKAEQAGAAAIVVSNHGGRVLDGCLSTAEVLPEIAAALGKRIKILVDGGIRTGSDIFKALALGADAVIIARPFVNAVFGAEDEGIKIYVEKLAAELEYTMYMAGAHSLTDIVPQMVRQTDWN